MEEFSTERLVCGVFGVILNFISVALQGPAHYRIMVIQKVPTTFQLWPYYLAILNSGCWLIYGLPKVHPNSLMILIVNAIAMFLSLLYVGVYFIYATNIEKKSKLLNGVHLLAVGVGIAAFFVVTLKVPGKTKLMVAGILCDISGSLTYASPFINIIRLVQTGNVSFIPLLPSTINIANGALWIAYGVIDKFDLYVVILNAVGAFFGIIQVGFYIGYYSGNHSLIS